MEAINSVNVNQNLPVSLPQDKNTPHPHKKTLNERRKEIDIYIESHLRKLGYMDEVGESLRPILETSNNGFVRQIPNLSYIPAATYMALDVADKYKKGEDGTGHKPSLKMAAREALYQGIVSFALPMAIVVNSVNKLTQVAANVLPEPPKVLKEGADKVDEFIKGRKDLDAYAGKIGTVPKLVAAGISIFALLKLSKPIDVAMHKIFSWTVDPILGIKDGKEKTADDTKPVKLSEVNKAHAQKAGETVNA